MTKKGWFLILFLVGFYANSQNISSDFRSKKIKIDKDTISFDSVPINPQNFKLRVGQKIVYPTEYQISYNKALLIIDSKKYQEITIDYFRFPSFITKTYSPFDKKFIISNNSNTGQLFSLTSNKKPSELKLFDGLKTSGYINRGITSGNNQSTVANASMDINLEGKLSDKVSIRANIFDTNIPLQENGYSQSITDFDRIFIELYSKDWRVKAGDVSLTNKNSFFLAFEKQVSGLEVEASLNNTTKVAASGAIVRGQFSSYNFIGIEGNQGPYKIFGPNNEPNFVIIAGSEKVFVNGSEIIKGTDEDYLIDYNIGEIRFNTTFPITNDMRIRVEFQFSNRNYTRFISYEKAEYKSDKLEISGYFYNENDVKNQPIQVSLSANQKQILANAGNNPDLMIGESAYPDAFVLLNKKWKLLSDLNYLFIHKNFNTIQRFQSVEFNRDWNLNNPTGNQQQVGLDLSLKKSNDNFLTYSFQQLQFSNNFKGNKHIVASKINFGNTLFYNNSSYLVNNSDLKENTFLRIKSGVEQHFKKFWFGGFFNLESNDGVAIPSREAILTNHQFKEYEGYIGIGDTTNVYAKIGYNYRDNDSIRSNSFTQINNRKTYYLDAKLIETDRTNLSLYANYRETENTFSENQKALNSRIQYNHRFFNNFITLGTRYETSSGNVAQQDFVYVEVEPGQGYYTWIDYNDNGIQEFDEFEIAEFQDQANFLRLPLPNLQFLATQSAKINQSITLNASQWSTKKGLKKVLSHFYNQFFLSSNNELKRTRNSFNLNPFNVNRAQQISVNFNFKNSLYFNRGLQNFSTTYTFANADNKQQYSIGSQETETSYQQLDFQHKLGKFWLVDLQGKLSENNLETENFNNRNYQINSYAFQPKISYVLNNDNRFSAFYHVKDKKNNLAEFELLKQQKIGIEYFYSGKSTTQFNANFTTFFNDFDGNPNSPVGYQMLEGLQEGTNYTWTFLWSKKLNSYLNLNLNYKGRKSLNSKTIHTGSINLKAIF